MAGFYLAQNRQSPDLEPLKILCDVWSGCCGSWLFFQGSSCWLYFLNIIRPGVIWRKWTFLQSGYEAINFETKKTNIFMAYGIYGGKKALSKNWIKTDK